MIRHLSDLNFEALVDLPGEDSLAGPRLPTPCFADSAFSQRKVFRWFIFSECGIDRSSTIALSILNHSSHSSWLQAKFFNLCFSRLQPYGSPLLYSKPALREVSGFQLLMTDQINFDFVKYGCPFSARTASKPASDLFDVRNFSISLLFQSH